MDSKTSRKFFLLISISIFPAQSLFGDNTIGSGMTAGSANSNLIICVTRYARHYSTVYDTILVDKCHPTTTTKCQISTVSVSEPVSSQTCQSKTEKQCTSKVETVYENGCSTSKEESCKTVYDTEYKDECTTAYVRICGGFSTLGSGGGYQDNGGYRNGGGHGNGAQHNNGGGYGREGIPGFGHRRTDAEQDLAKDVRRRRSVYGRGVGCSKVPQQKCGKVAHKQPRKVCSSVPRPACHTKPRQVHKQECRDIPSKECKEEVRQVAKGVPKEVCSKQVVKKCDKFPRKIPRQVAHKVPRKHCKKVNTNRDGPGYHLVGVLNGQGAGEELGYLK